MCPQWPSSDPCARTVDRPLPTPDSWSRVLRFHSQPAAFIDAQPFEVMAPSPSQSVIHRPPGWHEDVAIRDGYRLRGMR